MLTERFIRILLKSKSRVEEANILGEVQKLTLKFVITDKLQVEMNWIFEVNGYITISIFKFRLF